MNSIMEWLLGMKVGDLAEQDSWRLGLTAGYNNYVTLLLVAALAVMVYLTIRSYRREGAVPRRAKVTLATIRITVIVLAFIILFKPAVVLQSAQTVYNWVVILIDDSRSMSFKDRYSDQAQRKELETFLGDGDHREDSSAGSPDSSAHPSVIDLEDKSRSDLVRAAVLRPQGAIVKLAAEHPLILMSFSNENPRRHYYTRQLGIINNVGAPMPDTTLTELAAALKGLQSAGRETNIRRALREVLKRLQGRRLGAIVLLSDGQVTSQSASLGGTKAYAAKRGVPLLAVVVGDPTPPKELTVVGLQAPRHVRRKARVEMTVTLAHRNMANQDVTVRLFRRRLDQKKWTDTGSAETVVLQSADEGLPDDRSKGVQTVLLHNEPKELGEFIYKAVVDVRNDEQDKGDNSALAPVEVTDDKIKVLLISGDSNWGFQYLRNYLLRAPNLYRLSVWQQNADKEINQVASTGMKLSRLPRKLEELIGSPGGKPHPGYDVVILCDPQPTRGGFDGPFVESLELFVKRHGKGLCYVAGNKYTDDVIGNTRIYKPLGDMLPVVLAANSSNLLDRIRQRRPTAWSIGLTSYGVEHAICRLGGSAKETRHIWDILPPMYWTHPVLKAKPIARVLAESANPMRRTEKNKPEPVLAVQTYGKGRTVYVGMNSTWRWRFVRDGFYHQRFWGNVVRYLATLGSKRVVITTGGDRFEAGERITIEVEAYDKEYRPLADDSFVIKIVNVDKTNGDKPRKIKLQAVTDQPGRYRGSVDDIGTGTFELTSDRDMGEGAVTAPKRITIEPPRAENARREADPAFMRTVPSRPQYFMTLQQADRLGELIPPWHRKTIRETPRELWDCRLMLLTIVILLGVEWVLRKKYNMA